MVRLPHIEYQAGSACNFCCANCSQYTPIRKPFFTPLDVFERDVMNFAKVVRTDHFEFDGGEQTLNPHLFEMVDVVKKSGISPELHIFTNGSTLDKQPEEFWKAFDRVLVGNYPGKNTQAQINSWTAKAERYGHRLQLNTVSNFRPVVYRKALDEKTAKQHFDGCGYQWDRAIANGYFYACAMFYYVPTSVMGLPEGTDGIPLEGLTEEKLTAYLNKSWSPKSCQKCAMNTPKKTCVMQPGEGTPWHETSRAKWFEESSI